MARTVTICYLVFVSFSISAQKITDGSGSGYFIAVKRSNIEGGRVLSRGDNIKVKPLNGKLVWGKITEMSPDYILIDAEEKIETDSIKWIKNPKPTSIQLGTGIVFVALGTATLVSIYTPGTLEDVELKGAGGIGLIILGVATLDPPKYKLNKKDQLVYMEGNK